MVTRSSYMNDSFQEIREGMICILLPTRSLYGISDMQEYHNKLLLHGKDFHYNEISHIVFNKAIEYKAILNKIYFNKFSHLISPHLTDDSKTSVLCPNVKCFVELFLIEENIKTNMSFPRFQDSLKNIL